MRKYALVTMALICIVSCVQTPTISAPPLDNGGFVLMVENPTRYNVYFEGGQRIAKNTSGARVSLSAEEGTLTGGFDILYEIPLSEKVALFCKGDHRTLREDQSSFRIEEPDLAENYGVIVTITNNANNAISFYTGGEANPEWVQKGDPIGGNYFTRSDKREFSPGETAVFDISRDSSRNNYFVRDSRRNIPLAIPSVRKNYIYRFVYDPKNAGQPLTLADSRPLHRIGEAGWVKSLGEAAGPPALVSGGTDVQVFAPAGDGFDITCAIQAGTSAFLLAGFTENWDTFTPAARLEGADGVLRSALEPSKERAYRSAYFLAAAPKDTDSWLLAGGGAENSLVGHTAYIRMVREEGGKLAAVWELGGGDFDRANKTPAVKCGEVKSLVWDAPRNRALLTGENIEYDALRNPVPGSYLAVVSGDGSILSIDTSYKSISFYKILVDAKGNYYLAGEEHKGSGSSAVLIKYDAAGKQLWRQTGAPSYSWYADAVLDAEDGQIVLAGTLRARSESGEGGIPFIECVDTEKSTLLWREELKDPAFAGTALVTAIAPAQDYGFVVALCGIANDYYAKPFITARLNSRGRLMLGD